MAVASCTLCALSGGEMQAKSVIPVAMQVGRIIYQSCLILHIIAAIRIFGAIRSALFS
jgi:hypothetical protein